MSALHVARGSSRAATVALIALAAVPLLSLFGHPVLGYARSASMEPALAVGDGFVVNPLVHHPRVGDVVLFESVLHGGDLAVHRVVGGDASGYATRGDANPVTDQEAGEPPVTPDRVRGVLVTRPGGELLVLPGAGIPLLELGILRRRLLAWAGSPLRLLAAASAALGLLLLVLPRRAPPRRAPRPRSSARPTAGLVPLPRRLRARHAAVVALALASVAVWHVSHAAYVDVPLSLVVTESPAADQTRATTPGGVLPRDLAVAALPLLPTVVVVEPGTPRVRVLDDAVGIAAGGDGVVRVEERAGPDAGLQEDSARVWRYPAVLPPEQTLALHRAYPGSPFLVLGGAVLAFAGAWYRALGVGDVPLAVLLGARASRGGAR